MPDSTLIIEPGVKVKFRQSGVLEILGNAYMWGVDKHIEFSNESETSHAKKYLILNSQNTVQIDGLSLFQPGIGIEIKSGQPSLKNIASHKAKYSAISIKGNANVSISRCQLEGSSTSAIVLSGRSRLTLDNCKFRQNKPFHIQNSSNFSVKAKNVSFDKSASRTVLGKIEVKQ